MKKKDEKKKQDVVTKKSTACNCYSCKSLSHQSLYADNC